MTKIKELISQGYEPGIPPFNYYGSIMGKEKHTHCYHGSGQMLLSNPPQMNLICCHCGKTKRETIGGTFDTIEHGKYAPENHYNVSNISRGQWYE